jgi:hypothetical protein
VISELVTHLREMAPRATPFWWWDSVIDESSSALDLAAIRERGDFASDLLAYSDAALADPPSCDALVLELAEALPTALRRDLDRMVADPGRRRALLQAARERALDELTRRP